MWREPSYGEQLCPAPEELDIDWLEAVREVQSNKKVLKKLCAEMDKADLRKLRERQEQVGFSVICRALEPGVQADGSGYAVCIYYEPKDERKVLFAFKAAGVTRESSQAELVDPNSSSQDEQDIMLLNQPLWFQIDDSFDREYRYASLRSC
mmetsp:Transcript_43086/g.137008  ORF Transcript_43086/g.137008 Transcript_43086/m.137008 type:complete len:151 (-) Transcript_43086:147-599(-)